MQEMVRRTPEMNKAQILEAHKKNLGILIIQNKKKITKGIITDGQIRRFNQKKNKDRFFFKKRPKYFNY